MFTSTHFKSSTSLIKSTKILIYSAHGVTSVLSNLFRSSEIFRDSCLVVLQTFLICYGLERRQEKSQFGFSRHKRRFRRHVQSWLISALSECCTMMMHDGGEIIIARKMRLLATFSPCVKSLWGLNHSDYMWNK